MKQEQIQRGFWKLLQSRINELLQSDVEWAEIVSILGALIWGIVLMLPFDTFSTSKTYNLISFLPEWLWSVAFLTFFVCQSGAILYANIVWRVRMVIVGAIVWATICSMAVGANPVSTAYFYLIPTLGCVWAFARLSRYRV